MSFMSDDQRVMKLNGIGPVTGRKWKFSDKDETFFRKLREIPDNRSPRDRMLALPPFGLIDPRIP